MKAGVVLKSSCRGSSSELKCFMISIQDVVVGHKAVGELAAFQLWRLQYVTTKMIMVLEFF